MSISSKMTAIADKVRDLSGVSGKLGFDAIAENLGEAVTTCDSQAELIAQIQTALEGKSAGGGVKLPTLTNPGVASDLAQGKQLIDQEGKIVEGTALMPGGGFIYPDGAFAPVANFTNGKQYALVALIDGNYRYINTTTYNNYTMNATTITIAEDAGDYVVFGATPAMFTAVASGDGFLLQNGSNYLHGTTSSGTALRVGTTQAVWKVDASETGGFSSGKYLAKEDSNAVWLFNNSGGYNWSIKYETAGSFGYDRSGRDNTYSTGFVSFILYEYVAGEGEVSPVVDTSDANVTADKMLNGYSGYAKGRKIEGSIQLQSKTATANGTVTPDNGYLLSSVVVEIPSNGGGATIATKTTKPSSNTTSISFTGLTAEPKMFAINPTGNITLGSTRYVTSVIYDGSKTHGIYGYRSSSSGTSYYSASYFTWTYSNGTLTVKTSSSTNGGNFSSSATYQLTYVV